MPIFEYVALKPKSSESINGRIDADTVRDARSKIRSRGETPVTIHEVKADSVSGTGALSFLSQGNFKKDILLFTVQLSTLLKSGINLTESLKVLGEQSVNKNFAKILNLIYQDVVEKGSSFAEALKRFPNCFSSLYVSMVRSGESTGNLPVVLNRLANFAKKRAIIEGRVKSAMTYPIIMLVIGSFVVIFMLTYLIPKITPILEQKKEALPLATEILMSISDFLESYWWSLGILFVVLMMVYKAVRSTEKGNFFIDSTFLKIPVFGDLICKSAVSRFCITLSSLLQSGVRIQEAMVIVEQVVDNAVVGKTVRLISEKIKEGQSISGPLSEDKVFPKVVTYMISVGEKAGSDELQEMLENIAESYDTEIEQSADRLTALLNPIMLIFLAGLVGFILLAIVMPIMNLSKMN